MTELHLDYDALWAEVDLVTDPGRWARATVRERWEAQGCADDPARADAVAAGITGVLEVLRRQDPPPLMAFLLHPHADDPPVTVVAVRTDLATEPVALDEVADVLRLPAEMLEKPAEESVVDTAAGPAVRLVQRYLAPVEPGIEEVAEAIAYAWVIRDDEDDVVVTLSTSFDDLVAAAAWQPTVDELALSLRVEP